MRIQRVLSVALGCFGIFSARPAPAITIVFDPNVVRVTGVTARANVAIYAVGQTPKSGSGETTWMTTIADDDGDGTVVFPLRRAVPEASIWIAVDLAGSAFAVGTPAGYTPLTLSNPVMTAGQQIKVDGLYFVLFVARRAVGAWQIAVGDGSPFDADGTADRRVTALLSQFTPIGGSATAPASLLPGDIVVVIDPLWMRYYATQIAG